ncbi:MAG: saccharopine dehydrogenase NADP-binding domain-containing protein [Candidatus Acetothermia bacterium]|jgi:saccharopine dehydrogenase-like NADP-dependent oxidoreductase|nr:saccharopine dehydrogenase NADP-binding domain-containing protein [Candidatus Acetothermia bacterium]
MKVLVFGGTGKIGAAVAWDLAREATVETVGLVARSKAALERTKRWIGSPKIRLHQVDASGPEAQRAMAEYDVGVIALPDRRTSYKVAHLAIENGLHIVDMLEEYHRRPDAYETEGLETPPGMSAAEYGEWLHGQAVKNEVTFLDGIGFAPGLSNITVGEGIRKLDRAESAIARVGGIPAKAAAARHPLRYMVTWAFDHVLREYMIKVQVITEGKVVEVDALTDRERFRFRQFGVDEELECAITPGMPSFIYTRPELREFAEKTIRWPGHYQAIDVLKECGLLDLTPVRVGRKEVVPREFLSHLLTPKLQPGPEDTDVCVMWNTVQGTKGGRRARIDYYLWDEADRETGISSMARVTGFAAAIGARFVGAGKIKATGIVAPEDAIAGDLYAEFIAELAKRRIVVREILSVQ